jgi:16S rRNA (guanine(966)-N(2))-methyltransferase RsmD
LEVKFTVKVSGGALKGRKICRRAVGKASGHGILRATSSKVRESIFNILGQRIKDAIFVDLYAGTGAVGTEAMSRGAESVYFVEADKKRAEGIEELLSGCGCRGRAIIVKSKAVDFINRAMVEGQSFDIVFLDPPYGSDELEKMLPLLGECTALAEDALVMAEHSSKVEPLDNLGSLSKSKTYKYGDTALTIYRKV